MAADNGAVKVLVVDDSVGTLTSTVMYLKLRGFVVTGAGCGQDAVALFEQEHPAVVVLDLGLPDMDGFDALEAMAGTPAGANATFLAVSGSDDGPTRQRVLGSAFKTLLVKPVSLESLERAVLAAADGGP